MRTHLRAGRFAALAAVTVLAAIVAAPAEAARVGIGDQKPETFSDPNFAALGTKQTRFIAAWNSIYVETARLDRWIGAARAAGLQPLIAFQHAPDDSCPGSPCRLPSVGEYRQAIRDFRARYPFIRNFQPWNEANHMSQPTARNPRRAAQYYNVLRAECKSCRITAADVLDSKNMERWLRTFLRYAKGKPRLWGLHNYTDTNRFRTSGTERLLRTVKGEVWLTETGGVYRFQTADGRIALAASERRAARSITHVFRIAATFRKRIKRVYLYQWRAFPNDRFDAGIVNPDGSPRQSYDVVRRLLRGGAKPLPGRRR